MPYGFNQKTDEEKEPAMAGQGYEGLIHQDFSSVPGARAPAEHPSTPASPAGSAATQTGFVNYGDLYNANADVAKREAGRVNKGVTDTAQAAQDAIQKQQGGFNEASQAGTVQAATADEMVLAGQRSAANKQADATAQAKADSQSGGAKASTFASAFDNLQPTPDGEDPEHAERGRESAQRDPVQGATGWQAKSHQGYTGPASLADTEGYGDLLKQVHTSDQQIGNLGSEGGIQTLAGAGAKAGDAALLGTAGGGDFRNTQKVWGGGPDQKSQNSQALDQYAKADQGTVAARQASSDEAAKGYGDLVTNYENANAPKTTAGGGPVGQGPSQSQDIWTALGAEGSNFWGGKLTSESAGKLQQFWSGLTPEEQGPLQQLYASGDKDAFLRALVEAYKKKGNG